jgi:membrane fusion protein (multidrug efflux system)
MRTAKEKRTRMHVKRMAVPLLKLVVLGACALGVFWLWKGGKTPDAEASGDEAVHSDVEVQVGRVTRRTLRRYVAAYGTVSPAPPAAGQPAASGRVMSAVPGAVAEVLCSEGQRVEKGTPLFRLDSRVADAAVARQQDALAFAEQTLARQRKLAPTGGIAAKTLQEAEQQVRLSQIELKAAVAQQALLQLTSPTAGTVVRVQARPGDVVDLATTLAEVIDLDRLVVAANVPSADLGQLKVGEKVDYVPDAEASQADRAGGAATLPATAPVLRQGRVTFINPVVDPKSDLGTTLFSLPEGARWSPGQMVRARVVVGEHADRLVVPVDSVVDSEGGGKVVCVVEGDRAVQKPVHTGFQEGGYVEVDGDEIAEGVEIVTIGAYGLPKETKVHRAAPANPLGAGDKAQ